MKITCIECGQNLPEIDFWEVRIGRNEHKRHNRCKECCLKTIHYYDFETIVPLLKELNFPYIKEELERLCFYFDAPPANRMLISRYLSKMKLMSFRDFTFEDSDMLNEINEKRKKDMEERYGKI